MDQVREKISNQLIEMGYEDSLFLDEFKYWDEAIIGVSTSGNLIYSYDLLVDKYVKQMIEENPSGDIETFETDAIEFIETNTLKSLPFITTGVPPIIMYENIICQFEGEL